MAGFAALRHHDDELASLREIQKQVQRNTPKKGEKISQTFANLVAEFHSKIHSMAHSEMEARRADSYWRMSEFYLFNGTRMRPGGKLPLAIADRQRAAIVEAIAARDETQARRLMEEHMQGKPERVGARGADSP